MNLLVISERFWPEGSGGTLATYLITKLLAQCRGLNITVISGTPNPAKISGVRYIIDPMLKCSNKPELWLRLSNPLIRKRYRDLMRVFDVIYLLYTYPLVPLAKELRKRVIVHLHDYQPVAYNSTILYGQRGGFINDIRAELMYELLEHHSATRALLGSLLSTTAMLCRLWVSEADIVICVSKKQAQIIMRKAPELKGKIKVLYNPPPEGLLMEKKFEHPTFTYAGGASYIKGFYVFLEGASKLIKRGSHAKFLLTSGLRHLNKRIVVPEFLPSTFTILGLLPYKEVLRLYSRSYAVVVPSLWEEPFGYVVLESMLMGTIPIASRVGGIPEIVCGTPAESFLFTPGNSDELENLMEKVLSMDKEYLYSLGAKLRRAALKKFNSEHFKHKIMRIFLG